MEREYNPDMFESEEDYLERRDIMRDIIDAEIVKVNEYVNPFDISYQIPNWDND